MSTPFHKLSLCAAVILCASSPVLAVPVTFQVNLGYQTDLFAFQPATGTVTVHGSFNSWGPGVVLTNSPANTNLYTGTVDVTAAAGSTVQYKFVYNNNDGAGDKWESLGTPNRYFVASGAPLTLPEAFFSDQWAGGASMSVTFQVNMSAQIAAGNFHPDTDTVEIRGSFNSWGGGFSLTQDPARPGIYQGTYEEATRPPGSMAAFKCVYLNGSGAQWEGLSGYPDGNRWFVFSAANQTLPVVYYADASGVPIKAAIYFQVNLNTQILLGNYDPTNDQVWVRGSLMGWGAPPEGCQLFEDSSRPGIYTNLYTRDGQLTGATIEYKFTLFRSFVTTVWEDGANKSLSFTGLEPTNAAGYHVLSVGPTFFNNAALSDYLTADTLVTFQVNMAAAAPYPDHAPLFNGPGGDVVIVNGDFLPNGWNTYGTWGSVPAETLLYDDGTHGDAVARDQIYSIQFQLNKGAKARIQYKYGINGFDNEAPSQQDHVRYVRSIGSYIMPLDVFGTQFQEPSFGNLKIQPPRSGKVMVSWLGRPGVRLQTSPSLHGSPWTEHPATDGLSSTNFPIGPGQLYFRLVQ